MSRKLTRVPAVGTQVRVRKGQQARGLREGETVTVTGEGVGHCIRVDGNDYHFHISRFEELDEPQPEPSRGFPIGTRIRDRNGRAGTVATAADWSEWGKGLSARTYNDLFIIWDDGSVHCSQMQSSCGTAQGFTIIEQPASASRQIDWLAEDSGWRA